MTVHVFGADGLRVIDGAEAEAYRADKEARWQEALSWQDWRPIGEITNEVMKRFMGVLLRNGADWAHAKWDGSDDLHDDDGRGECWRSGNTPVAFDPAEFADPDEKGWRRIIAHVDSDGVI